MKIAGRVVNAPARDVIVFPRANIELSFWLVAVESFEPLDLVCPRPKPPQIIKRGKALDNMDDPTFQLRIQEWLNRRQHWLVLKALADPENEIEWEAVDINDPKTWEHVEKELKAIGLTDVEYNRLVAKVYEVNALTESAMERARANFLLMTSLENSEGSESQKDEQDSLQSGQPV
jgi:hypothetical protein